MKYVDTNIFVRVITKDIPDLARQAEKIITSAPPGELFVIDGVVQETCYVLQFNPLYNLPREEIHRDLKDLLLLPAFRVSDIVISSLEIYREFPKLDFVDCLILVKAGLKKDKIVSFDKDLLAAAK